MAPSTIRRAIGAVKDQASISIAKVAGNLSPELEVLVVKATSHDEDPAGEEHLREIVRLTLSSRGYARALAAAVARRLGKTRDWIVALKCLALVHRVSAEGPESFKEEVLVAERVRGRGRGGVRLLDMAGFQDEAHSGSWDHSSFVRLYALYLDSKVESLVDEKRAKDRNAGEESGDGTPMREMRPELVVEKLGKLLRILDRILACRPAGEAKSSRLVAAALRLIVKDSFGTYGDVCEAVKVLPERFREMGYGDCVNAFSVCIGAKRMADELAGFYGWCKNAGIARPSDFPEAPMGVSDEVLGTLEGFLKEMVNGPRSGERNGEEKALPPPEDFTPMPRQAEANKPWKIQKVSEDLVDLRDNGVSADEQGNELALDLFSGPGISTAATATNGSWEAFPEESGEPEMTSAWQNPAAGSGNADWELALVESAASLSKQKAELGGGLDPLLLSGMYDHGAVRQHARAAQAGGWSASSAALPAAPDGTMRGAAGNEDPFAASAAVPPPAYVQMAEMERRQQLPAEEQYVMQGQVASVGYGYYGPNPHQTMPYGMQSQGQGQGQGGWYHYYPPY